jgi:GNAT superfamily N-acetyltransferase
MSADPGAVTLRIRRAVAADVPVLAQMIEELNADQREPLGHVTTAAVARDGFGERPEFEALLAELDGAPIGYALYHPSWSTEVGEKGFYLYDLYVREAARGHGVGRALLAATAVRAKEDGRTFLWWSSKDWNRKAQDFYRRLGAIEESVKAHALFGEAFDSLAASERPGPASKST